MSDMFNRFGGNQNKQKKQENPQIQNGLKSMNEFVDKFYRVERGFKGGPEQILQNLLDSGHMSQEDYKNVSDLARKIITGKA